MVAGTTLPTGTTHTTVIETTHTTAVETIRTRGRTTPTQTTDRTGTTPTTGAGTTKAGTPGRVYNYSDNYDSRRRLNRYRHQPRYPKNNIRFEYNARDTDI